MKEIGIVGLDLAKRVFQVHTAGSDGAVVLRRKPMSGVINLMGDVGREREHLHIPSFCDVFSHAAFDE